MQKTIKFKVFGKVQGVGFRFFTLKTAKSLGINGFVKNCYDQTVEIVATQTEKKLSIFKKHLFLGPKYSEVLKIEEQSLDLQIFSDFSIH